MKRLLILGFLLTAQVTHAQTAIVLQNPSFETPALMLAGSNYNCGPIPSWTLTAFGCNAGLWQPGASMAVPDGVTVVWAQNGGGGSQDSGIVPQPSTLYTLTVYVGHRPGYSGSYTLNLNAGKTLLCTVTAPVDAIPAGTFVPETLPCTTPAAALPSGNLMPAALPLGNLAVSFIASTGNVAFDSVSLTAGVTPPPPPLQIAFPGGAGGTGFTATFPIANAGQVPSCTPADGVCSLAIQITLPDGTVVTGSTGAVAIVKTTAAQTLTVPIVTVTAGP